MQAFAEKDRNLQSSVLFSFLFEDHGGGLIWFRRTSAHFNDFHANVNGVIHFMSSISQVRLSHQVLRTLGQLCPSL